MIQSAYQKEDHDIGSAMFVGVMFSFAGNIQDAAVKEGKFIDDFYRMTVDVYADIRFWKSGGLMDENLTFFDAGLHPEAILDLALQVCRCQVSEY